jgi:hypothetical protein
MESEKFSFTCDEQIDWFDLDCDSILDPKTFIDIDKYWSSNDWSLMCFEDMLPSPLLPEITIPEQPSLSSSEEDHHEVENSIMQRIHTFIAPNNISIKTFKLFDNTAAIQFYDKDHYHNGYYFLELDNHSKIKTHNLIDQLEPVDIVCFVSKAYIVISNYICDAINVYSREEYKAKHIFRLTCRLHKRTPLLLIKNKMMYIIVKSINNLISIHFRSLDSKFGEIKTFSKNDVIVCHEDFLPYIFSFTSSKNHTICNCFIDNTLLWKAILLPHKYITAQSIIRYNSDNIFITYSLNAHQVIYDINLITGVVEKEAKFLLPTSSNMCYTNNDKALITATIVDNSLYVGKLLFDTFLLSPPFNVFDGLKKENLLNIYVNGNCCILFTSKRIYKLYIESEQVAINHVNSNPIETLIQYNSKYVMVKHKDHDHLVINKILY